MTKKFLVFAGQQFYANGGANDLVSTSCKTEEEAIKYAKSLMGEKFCTNNWYNEDKDLCLSNDIEWAHVFDLEKCEVVFKVGKVYGDETGIIIL